MFSCRVVVFLLFLATSISAVKKHRRHVSGYEANSNCPPSGGIIKVQSQSHNIAGLGTEGGLSNLIFMCGTTQVSYQVPSRWALREGLNGTKVNVTIYEKKFKTIPLCCSGYIRDDNDFCVPKCKGACANGLCVSPNNCVCYEGYQLNSLGQCVVTCPCGCPNGKCQGDTCVCRNGYRLENGVCNPVCVNECNNGECTSPGNCTCHPGYQKKRNQDSHLCFPHCSSPCENGKCVAPDICQCNEGYRRERNTARCIPKCTGCEHGDCVAPYMCHCHKGYRREDEACVPDCQCVNATCVEPNKCHCFPGYTHTTPYICEPRCFPSCRNAHCTAPNKCECYPGHTKKPGLFSHKCVPMSIIGSIINSIRNR